MQTFCAKFSSLQILVTVNEKRSDAELVKEKVQKTKDEAEALLKIISKDKVKAEKKLKAAEPALLEAEAALQVTLFFSFQRTEV